MQPSPKTSFALTQPNTHTNTQKMPYRKASLSNRLRAIPRTNLESREPHEIVGTAEWATVRNRVAFLEGRSHTMTNSTCITRNELAKRQRAERRVDKGVRSQLVDQILDFIDAGEWAQVEGGEHDGRWINPKHYPERIFDTGRVKEASTGEMHYFPLSGTEEDPKGLALHYKVSGCGLYYTIGPNIWREYHDPLRLKRERRMKNRAEREAMATARQIAGESKVERDENGNQLLEFPSNE